jgi:hypothetical protein
MVVECQLFCFLDRYLHTEQSEQAYCYSGETNLLIPTSQVVFFAHFPTDTIRYQCSNVGLCFALWNKFIMQKSMHVGKNNENALYISANLSCHFMAWALWAVPQRLLLLGFWVVPVDPRVIMTCDHL